MCLKVPGALFHDEWTGDFFVGIDTNAPGLEGLVDLGLTNFSAETGALAVTKWGHALYDPVGVDPNSACSHPSVYIARATLISRQFGPWAFVKYLRGALDILLVASWNLCPKFRREWVCGVKPLSTGWVYPLTIDVGLIFFHSQTSHLISALRMIALCE